MDKIRSYKILGVATFDLVTGFSLFSGAGYKLLGKKYAVSIGLLSVPFSVLTHVATGIETPLSRFVMSGSPHIGHAMFFGSVAGTLGHFAGLTDINSINVAMTTAIVATLYMRQYDHSLPKSVKKKLRSLTFRGYMFYNKYIKSSDSE